MPTVNTKILTTLREGSNAGKVTTDDRGNSVWDWGDEQSETEETSILLNRLDNTQLSLAADITSSEPALHLEEGEHDEGGGFNPYAVGGTRKNPFK